MNKCAVCGKEFYSDTDFEEHQFIEEVRKAAENNGSLFRLIASDILDLAVLMVQQREHCDIEQATRIWFGECARINNTWNQLIREQRDDTKP